MKKVILTGRIKVHPDDLEDVRSALPDHIELTRAEPGCIVFKVTESLTEKGSFDVYEEFNSPETFENHQKRDRESHWGNITKNVEREYTIEGLGDMRLIT